MWAMVVSGTFFAQWVTGKVLDGNPRWLCVNTWLFRTSPLFYSTFNLPLERTPSSRGGFLWLVLVLVH